MKDTRRVDFGSGLGFMGLAVLIWTMAGRLPRVTPGIGPGDYPKVISAGLFAFGAILVRRPISLTFLVLSVVSVALSLYSVRPERKRPGARALQADNG